MFKTKAFLRICSILILISISQRAQANLADLVAWAGQAPLASKSNAFIYGATVFTAFTIGNKIFYPQPTPWSSCGAVAAVATALNFGSLYLAPHIAGQMVVPCLNALQWLDGHRIKGFLLGCCPFIVGLGSLGVKACIESPIINTNK